MGAHWRWDLGATGSRPDAWSKACRGAQHAGVDGLLGQLADMLAMHGRKSGLQHGCRGHGG